MADINFYQRDPKEVARVNCRSESVAQELSGVLPTIVEYLEASKKENP